MLRLSLTERAGRFRNSRQDVGQQQAGARAAARTPKQSGVAPLNGSAMSAAYLYHGLRFSRDDVRVVV